MKWTALDHFGFYRFRFRTCVGHLQTLDYAALVQFSNICTAPAAGCHQRMSPATCVCPFPDPHSGFVAAFWKPFFAHRKFQNRATPVRLDWQNGQNGPKMHRKCPFYHPQWTSVLLCKALFAIFRPRCDCFWAETAQGRA